MIFLDVKTDYAFKKVFGGDNSKGILISFLNALIDIPGNEKITDLTILDSYQRTKLKGMKDTYLDVKAILSNGHRVIIEMQVLNVEGFEKRILFNAAKEYSNQLNAGEHHAMLSPVIALTITDFIMFKDAICGVAFDKVISYFKLREKEKEKYTKYSDDVELIFIELPKFNKGIEELEGITEKWIYFMKHVGKLDYIPETLAQDNEIKKAFGILNTAGMTEEELNEQRKRHTFIYMQKDILKQAMTAYEKGFKEGLKKAEMESKVVGLKKGEIKGKVEGLKKGKVEIAKNLLKAGFEIDAIVTLTGLNQREIEDIR